MIKKARSVYENNLEFFQPNEKRDICPDYCAIHTWIMVGLVTDSSFKPFTTSSLRPREQNEDTLNLLSSCGVNAGFCETKKNKLTSFIIKKQRCGIYLRVVFISKSYFLNHWQQLR